MTFLQAQTGSGRVVQYPGAEDVVRHPAFHTRQHFRGLTPRHNVIVSPPDVAFVGGCRRLSAIVIVKAHPTAASSAAIIDQVFICDRGCGVFCSPCRCCARFSGRGTGGVERHAEWKRGFANPLSFHCPDAVALPYHLADWLADHCHVLGDRGICSRTWPTALIGLLVARRLFVFMRAVRVLRGMHVPRPLVFVGLNLARRWFVSLRDPTWSFASIELACGVASQALVAFRALACAPS